MGQLFSSKSRNSNDASFMFSGYCDYSDYRDYSDYVIIESFQSSFSPFRENLPKNVRENVYPNYFNMYEHQLLQPKCQLKKMHVNQTEIKFSPNSSKNVSENIYPKVSKKKKKKIYSKKTTTLVNQTDIKAPPNSSKNVSENSSEIVSENVYPKVSNIQQPYLQPQPEFQLRKTLVNQTDIKAPPNSSKMVSENSSKNVSENVYPKVSNIQQEFQLKKTLGDQTDIKAPPNFSKNVSENVYPKVSNIQQPYLQPQPEFQLRKTLVNQTDIKAPPNSSKMVSENSSKNVSENVYPKVSNIQQPYLQPQPEFQLRKTLVNQTDIKAPPNSSKMVSENSSKNVSENVYPKVSNIQQPYLQPQPEFQLRKTLVNQTDIKAPPNSSKNVPENSSKIVSENSSKIVSENSSKIVSENVYPKVSNIQQPYLQPQPEFQLRKTLVNQTDIKAPPNSSKMVSENSSKNVSENIYPKVSNIQQPYLQPQPEFQLRKTLVNQTDIKAPPNSSKNVPENSSKIGSENVYPKVSNIQQPYLQPQPEFQLRKTLVNQTDIKAPPNSSKNVSENSSKILSENIYPKVSNIQQPYLQPQPEFQLKKTLVNQTDIKAPPNSSKNVPENSSKIVSENSSKIVSENVYPKVSNIQQLYLQPQPEFQLRKTLVNQTDIKAPPNSSKMVSENSSKNVSENIYPKVSNIQQPYLQPQPEFQLRKTLVNQTDIKAPSNSSKNVPENSSKIVSKNSSKIGSENVYPKVSNIQQPYLQPQPEFQLRKTLVNQTDIKAPPNSSKNVSENSSKILSENIYPKVFNIQQPYLQPQPEFQLKKTLGDQTDIKAPPNFSKNVSENVYPKVSNIQQPYLQPQPEFHLKKAQVKSESELELRLKKTQVNQTEKKFQPNSFNNVTENIHQNIYNMQQSFNNQQTVTCNSEKGYQNMSNDKVSKLCLKNSNLNIDQKELVIQKDETKTEDNILNNFMKKEPVKISSEKLNVSNAERYRIVDSINKKENMDTHLIQEIAKSLRGILMTPKTFISIPNKVKIKIFNEFKIDTKQKLEIIVDLIFEKAVSEPVCSLVYANLCQSLIDCCQKEVNISEKKLLTKEKSKKIDNQEITNQRLRIIRFMGELFKFKIVSENIMHTCVIELLKCEKVESAEDQLECLCKLFVSVGKDLDHLEAKFRVDHYFTQLNKIIDYRYISTKIKSEIRNIIDLRDCNWVETRDELNLKLFDQIKNEEKKEQEKEKVIPPYKKRLEGYSKNQKKMTNNLRDSSVQSGIGLSLSFNSLTNIQSKQKHFIAETIDKDESYNISLGSDVGSSISSHSKGNRRRSRRRSRSKSRSHSTDTSIECIRQNQTDYRDNLNEQIQPKNWIKKKDLTWEAYRIYRSKHPGPLTERSFQRWVRYDGIDDPSFKWRGKKN
ncbi:eukaryotic translation initiation factor 4 gamma isoform X3 [Hydra vulgaris]|uniref:eukaryotic translation initiation factor 4 gamma isoform X3 n=1 Tax=Hydra vulgaris TaxID=6087 RepID=UPI0032E9D8D9